VKRRIALRLMREEVGDQKALFYTCERVSFNASLNTYRFFFLPA
jgi:hypothetical protein